MKEWKLKIVRSQLAAMLEGHAKWVNESSFDSNRDAYLVAYTKELIKSIDELLTAEKENE